MKRKIFIIIAILLIITGIAIFCFPYITDYIYEEDVENQKEDFIEQMERLKNETTSSSQSNELDDSNESDSEASSGSETETESSSKNTNSNILEQLYQELTRRNEELYENKQENLVDPFSYEQPTIDLSEYGIKNNIIGYIEIPKINVELPILLGANTKNMDKGAVHLTETSYPIGGENTNSVIAAHRGHNRKKMFRYLNKLKNGDKIYIQNFREKLVYEVYEIKVIEPDATNELLIQDGQDIITLLTCHPYMVDTHRYLVRARRVTV